MSGWLEWRNGGAAIAWLAGLVAAGCMLAGSYAGYQEQTLS